MIEEARFGISMVSNPAEYLIKTTKIIKSLKLDKYFCIISLWKQILIISNRVRAQALDKTDQNGVMIWLRKMYIAQGGLEVRQSTYRSS